MGARRTATNFWHKGRRGAPVQHRRPGAVEKAAGSCGAGTTSAAHSESGCHSCTSPPGATTSKLQTLAPPYRRIALKVCDWAYRGICECYVRRFCLQGTQENGSALVALSWRGSQGLHSLQLLAACTANGRYCGCPASASSPVLSSKDGR